MPKHPLITRDKAIRALVEMIERFVGSEKGSGELWHEFCADMHLCAEWDGESTTEKDLPPSMWEILAAAGVDPDDITQACRMNPVSAAELREAGYGR